MYRALPLSRQVAFTGRGTFKVTRRRLATEAPATLAPKNKSIVRRVFFYSVAATGAFYVGSVFVAFNNQRYYDFFNESVPLGQAAIGYAEAHDWDEVTMDTFVHGGIEGVANIAEFISRQFASFSPSAKAKTEEKVDAEKAVAPNATKSSKDRLRSVTNALKTKVKKSDEVVSSIARNQSAQFSEGVADLIKAAEDALAGNIPTTVSSTIQSSQSPSRSGDAESIAVSESPVLESASDKPVYDKSLPLGHEPPFGFTRPKPPPAAAEHPPVTKEATPEPLPLLGPSLADLGASEPIIAQLALTIDNLTAYLSSNPSAAEKARGVLDTAKLDLIGLATRIDTIKGEERTQLEKALEGQAKDYTTKLLELEMEAQDKLDSQEEGFRKFFDEERSRVIAAYREKLEHELQTQTELINERLKEEVVAQGIELQRRWIREIKVRVEEERGGRLAKLDELAANLKKLERVALDNSSYLDENIRIHRLWSALRALNDTVESPVRKPFREELRVLRHIAAAKDDPVVVSALETLEVTDVPDIGVEPFADLATWFSTSVAPRVTSVALVPDQNAGVLSHLASHLFSSFRFKREGLVKGSDVLSVLARAEYYMNEKDLDSAARELNQLQGTAKILLSDWLEAARRRLEVLQALQVVQSQATLASLLVV